MGPDSQGMGRRSRRREGRGYNDIQRQDKPRDCELEAKIASSSAPTLKAHSGRRLDCCRQVLCPRLSSPELRPWMPSWCLSHCHYLPVEFPGFQCQSGMPECAHGAHTSGVGVAARLVPLGGSTFFAFRDELHRATKYSESGLPRLGAIVQEFMAQTIATSATGHLQGLRSIVLRTLGHTVSVDGLSECWPWG